MVVSFREIFGEQVSFLQAKKHREIEKVYVLYVRTRETKEEVSERVSTVVRKYTQGALVSQIL